MSERPGPSPEVKRQKPLPTRIEEEPKEFWEGLSPEEKEAMKTRHRSIAQLERYGAEVTEEGRLRIAGKGRLIERAKKEMEKELRERTLIDKIELAVDRFGRRVDRALEKWAPKLEAWATRAETFELGIRKTVASLAELPAKFDEWMVGRAVGEIKKLEEIKRADEEAFQTVLIELEEKLEERIQVKREELEGFTEECVKKKEAIIEEHDAAVESITEKYGSAAEGSERIRTLMEKDLKDLSDLKEEKIEPLRKAWQAKKKELDEFEKKEEKRFEREANQLNERYKKAAAPYLERLDKVVKERKSWEREAASSKNLAKKVRAFLGVESE